MLWGSLVRRINKMTGVIYIIIGILCFTACISIAIGDDTDAQTGIDSDNELTIEGDNDGETDDETE